MAAQRTVPPPKNPDHARVRNKRVRLRFQPTLRGYVKVHNRSPRISSSIAAFPLILAIGAREDYAREEGGLLFPPARRSSEPHPGTYTRTRGTPGNNNCSCICVENGDLVLARPRKAARISDASLCCAVGRSLAISSSPMNPLARLDWSSP